MWRFLLSAGRCGSHRHCPEIDLLTAYVDELSAPYLEDAETILLPTSWVRS